MAASRWDVVLPSRSRATAPILPRPGSAPLNPDAEYGCLLAFVVRPGEDALSVVTNKQTTFFKIGKRAEIVFDATIRKYVLNDGSKGGVALGDGGEIYLTVNDTVVTKCSQIPLGADEIKDMKTRGVSDEDVKRQEQFLLAQSEICENFDNPAGIWYLDNRGGFTVSVEQGR